MVSKPAYNIVSDGKNLPEPRKGRLGHNRLIVLAFLSLCVLACAAFWLTRTGAERNQYRKEAGDFIATHLEGTLFATVADILRPSPPPLPPQVTHPATEKGTLSGQSVTGVLAAPLDFGEERALSGTDSPTNEAQGASPLTLPGLLTGQEENTIIFDQEPVAPVTEDTQVRPGYLEALANWLVARYRPGPQGGTIAASVQALNQECGTTLAQKARGGRSGLLRYAFNSSMINGLYRLYVDRFLADLDAAAQRKGFSNAQNRQFHIALAGRAAILASSLDGVLRVPDLTARLEKIDALAQKVVDANADLATAVFEFDEVRSARAARQIQSAAQLRVNGASARYRRATEEHTQAQQALAAEIRRNSGQNLDEESLLFLAAWVGRRYAQNANAKGAVESCIGALRDFSNRCAHFGEGA